MLGVVQYVFCPKIVLRIKKRWRLVVDAISSGEPCCDRNTVSYIVRNKLPNNECLSVGALSPGEAWHDRGALCLFLLKRITRDDVPYHGCLIVR